MRLKQSVEERLFVQILIIPGTNILEIPCCSAMAPNRTVQLDFNVNHPSIAHHMGIDFKCAGFVVTPSSGMVASTSANLGRRMRSNAPIRE